MKKLLSIFALSLFVAQGASAATVTNFTQAPKGVFSPQGFDDNDDVLVAVSGVFSNFCFKPAPSIPRVDLNTRTIYIENRINSMDNCVSAMLYIPYTNIVNIGILPQGNYQVMLSDGKGGFTKRAIIPVVSSKPSRYSPDGELYAPVSEVQFKPGASANQATITLIGTLSNSCLSLEDVQVNVRANNVVEVLPRAELATGRGCALTPLPFSKTVTINNFPAGDTLLHVRSMGGQSVNRVITFLDRFHADSAQK